MRKNTVDDFFANIFRTENCWLWMGGLNNKGYGWFKAVNLSKTALAHRIMYELITGKPVDRYLQVCHKCDNPRCVNPDHLFLGTMKDNMQDASNKGRMEKRRFSPDQRRLMRKMWNEGLGEKRIARYFDCDASVVKRLNPNRPHPQKVVFTEEQVAEIIAKHRADIPLRNIGKEYGVSANPIVKLLKERNVFVPPKRGNPLHKK